MKIGVIFFILLLIVILFLFFILYFIGITNMFFPNTQILNNLQWLKFNNTTISFLYLIILSIFFIVVISIVISLIISFNHEKSKLSTPSSLDDFSIKTGKNKIEDSYDNLDKSLQKNIGILNEYSNKIDNDIKQISEIEIENNFQEKLDQFFQEFSQMISDISQSITVAELFEKALIWGVKFSHSKRGSLMVINKEKELYIYRTIGWSNKEKDNINDIKIPLGTGIAGKVAAENKRIFVTNIENYDNYEFKFKDNYQTKSFISLPISGVKNVVAVVNLTDNKKGYYSMNDLESLNIITTLSNKIFELIQRKKLHGK